MQTLAAVRLLLLFVHVMAFALALGCVLREDTKLLSRGPFDAQSLRSAGRLIRFALVVLWASGLALIVLDTGGMVSQVTDNPKMLAKLSVVGVLTLNGVALHWFAFPALFGEIRRGRLAAAIAASLGAVSAASWLAATLLGIARAQAKAFSYGELMAAYAAMLGVALGFALLFVRPLVLRKLRRGPHPVEALTSPPPGAHWPRLQ